MKMPRRSPRVGAYVCPRGVFAVLCRDAAGGIEIERTLQVPFALKTAEEAGDHLVSVLNSAGIQGANVSLAVRGFGVAHQTLQLPPAPDELLGPIIEREVRRLEPHLHDFAVQWMSLPSVETAGTGAPVQRSVLATAAPRETVAAFDDRLRAAGHRLHHVTTVPVAVQRLLDQFDSGTGTIATIAPLPDGAYIGFSLGGGVRIIVEPPLPQDMQHEAAALAEEIELASMFVRQQYRGINMDRVVLVGARESLTELKAMLGERLRIPVKQLEADDLGPDGFVALGAVLDSQSAAPQSLGGATRQRVTMSRRLSRVETASLVAVVILVLVGVWTIAESVRSVLAGRALATAQRRIEQDAFGLAPVRATAEQRRLVRDAVGAVRMVAADRLELQGALAGIAASVRPPAYLDSLRLARGDAGWRAVLIGSVSSSTNARAVQALHDLYRELPQRLSTDSLQLDRLVYADSSDSGAGVVQFQLSFAIPVAPVPR